MGGMKRLRFQDRLIDPRSPDRAPRRAAYALPTLFTAGNLFLGFYAIMEAFRAQGLPPPQVTVTTFSVGLRSFLGTSGRFVIAVPVSLLSLYSDRFALKRLPIELPQSQLAIEMITLKNRTLSPTTQLFIACAREVTRSLRKEKG